MDLSIDSMFRKNNLQASSIGQQNELKTSSSNNNNNSKSDVSIFSNSNSFDNSASSLSDVSIHCEAGTGTDSSTSQQSKNGQMGASEDLFKRYFN